MGPTLSDILDSIREFLKKYPREVVVLGINNIYGLSTEETTQLAVLIEKRLSPITDMMSWDMMNTLSYSEVTFNNHRLALFMSIESPKVINSSKFLCENWGTAGDSGNLSEYTKWMTQDVKHFATKRDRYYVLQANPNNNPNNMFDSVLQNDVGEGLFGFEYPFLRDLAPFVLSIKNIAHGARICAVSTDFMHTARVTEVALASLYQSIQS